MRNETVTVSGVIAVTQADRHRQACEMEVVGCPWSYKLYPRGFEVSMIPPAVTALKVISRAYVYPESVRLVSCFTIWALIPS